MTKRCAAPAVLCLAFLASCSILQNSRKGSSPDNAIVLDTLEFEIPASRLMPERPSETITIDVCHIELDLRFDWEKEEVIGKAKLTLTPHFYAADTIRLDARGFELKSVLTSKGSQTLTERFKYDESEILIPLEQTLKKGDTVQVVVDYIARPMLLEGGGQAITGSQGLYFIDPRQELDDVPTQLWSQGETEYNSGWFPCIDHPNQKHTQEIFLTVDEAYHTVSNGRLVYSSLNGDGTRTDYWKQDLTHSTYLAMIAVGEFAVVKDAWRDKDVWYYLDEEYVEHAEVIFGNTPEMLEFYSDLLGVDYPWEKYHQVIVKDFVSGAMENTSAVIHGDFVQQTPRDKLDENHEDVIAHELFHHWFGDLVTCESWAQITLNEGFATYGEYLWWVHKYGEDEARLHLQEDLEIYLSEAYSNPKPLIRHRYMDPDDVFDSHSYQKGGRVLHMLRDEIGDEAFFASLTAYLKKYAYATVEISDLRTVVEDITGRDMLWFFDQWYMQEGHPKVNAVFETDSLNALRLTLTQSQSSDQAYRFHVDLTWETTKGVTTKRLWVDDFTEHFEVAMDGPPLWYAIDPKGIMLWEVEEDKPQLAWKHQAQHAELGLSRAFGLERVDPQTGDEAWLITMAENDPFWYARMVAIEKIMDCPDPSPKELGVRLKRVASTDPHSYVRAAAIDALATTQASEDLRSIYLAALDDDSYEVMATGMYGIIDTDPCSALPLLEEFDEDERKKLYSLVLKAHAICGDPSSLEYFKSEAKKVRGLDLFILNNQFLEYARTSDNIDVYAQLADQLSETALKEDSWWMKLVSVKGLEETKRYFSEAIESGQLSTEQVARLKNKIANISAIIDEVSDEEMQDFQIRH